MWPTIDQYQIWHYFKKAVKELNTSLYGIKIIILIAQTKTICSHHIMHSPWYWSKLVLFRFNFWQLLSVVYLSVVYLLLTPNAGRNIQQLSLLLELNLELLLRSNWNLYLDINLHIEINNKRFPNLTRKINFNYAIISRFLTVL